MIPKKWTWNSKNSKDMSDNSITFKFQTQFHFTRTEPIKDINGNSAQITKHEVIFAESLEEAWEKLKSEIRKEFPKKKLFDKELKLWEVAENITMF